jgi:enoyl-CoA hydratase
MADELLVTSQGAVRIVTLNRPEAFNAVDEVLHRELALVWPAIAADPEVRAVVLTGAGTAFSGGGDLHLLERMANDPDLRARTMAEAADIVRAMAAVRVPIVAAVNGPAVGLGCSLVALSDLVVVEEQAYFADPHAALGLVAADGGAMTWPLLTGLLKAKEYILLGERLPAATAVEVGIANRLVPTGEALETALGLAERLAAMPPQAVQESKALLNRALHAAIGEQLDAALAAESASFDEPAFRANLQRMLTRK